MVKEGAHMAAMKVPAHSNEESCSLLRNHSKHSTTKGKCFFRTLKLTNWSSVPIFSNAPMLSHSPAKHAMRWKMASFFFFCS